MNSINPSVHFKFLVHLNIVWKLFQGHTLNQLGVGISKLFKEFLCVLGIGLHTNQIGNNIVHFFKLKHETPSIILRSAQTKELFGFLIEVSVFLRPLRSKLAKRAWEIVVFSIAFILKVLQVQRKVSQFQFQIIKLQIYISNCI